MTIRLLVVAALFASTGLAHADAISTSAPPPPSFLSGWTAGNGTDVLGSGVLQGNLNLMGGVAHNTSSTLSDVLYGKASASVGQVNGQTQIFFKRGIEGNYLLGSGHGILAAKLGTGKTVVGSAGGAVIGDATAKTGAATAGGSNGGGVSGGGNASLGVNNGSNGNGLAGNPINTGLVVPPGQLNNPGVGNPFQAVQAGEALAAEVPEPSSVALMLVGMLGAGALTRRRTR